MAVTVPPEMVRLLLVVMPSRPKLPLLLPPVLEGQMPPGLCRPQLLAVLVESGVLRPGQITVGTAES